MEDKGRSTEAGGQEELSARLRGALAVVSGTGVPCGVF